MSARSMGTTVPATTSKILVKFRLGLFIGGVLLTPACSGSKPAAPGELRLSIAQRCPTCHVPSLGSVRIRRGTGQGDVVATRDFNNATTFDVTLDTGVYWSEGGPNGG